MGILTDAMNKMFGNGKKDGMDEPVWSDAIAEFVNKEYTNRQMERKPFELQWRLNMEFLNGNQYLTINTATNSIEEVARLYWYQQRDSFNQMATIAETRVAKLGRQKPTMKTRPASADDKDISTAKIQSMLLGSSWYEQDMNDKYEEFVSWLETCGTCFWKPTWNVRKGRLIYQGQQPQQTPSAKLDTDQGTEFDDNTEQNLGRDVEQIEIREGDMDTSVVPCFEIYPDSSYRNDMREVRSLIHARAYHIWEIEEMYGVAVEGEEVDVMTMQKMSTGLGGMGYTHSAFRSSVTKLKDHAVVKEYYELPSKKYPGGRFFCVCGSKVLYAGKLPYMIGQDGKPELPFVRCVLIDRPGVFWGKTVTERCIPVQRRYNALRNRKAEYLNLVAIGQWYEPIGSITDDTELNNAPGNRIKYRPGINGAKPEPVTWPSLPSSFENEEQTLMSEFTAISGVSELSRFSEAPSGVKSGVALSIANEQDDTRMSTTSIRIANSVVKLGQYWMRMYRQFVQEPRMLRWVGTDREVDVRQWYASDLRSDDVFIENMSALSETPAQRRQMVFDLMNAGLFMRPELSNISDEGRQKIFEMLEFGHWETGYEDENSLHRSRARREGRNMMEGIPAQIMDYDNHALHIEQHNRLRMQSEWDELLKTPVGQLVNELMMQHISMHMQEIAKQQAAQMAAQAQAAQLQAGGEQQKQVPPTK